MSGPRAVAAIQARTSSTRLPGKVLADLGGRELVLRVVDRARAARRVDEVVVLTSVEASDDPLAALCEREGVPVRRGPLADVLARYLALLDEFEPAYVVRVTGDCPLVEPWFVDLQLEALAARDGDFAVVTNGAVEGVLAGQGVLSARALRDAARSEDPRDREHVGSFWLTEHRARFRAIGIEVDPRYLDRGLRLSVDEPGDLARMRRIWERFGPEHGSLVPVAEVLRFLDERPDVRALAPDASESADNRALRARRRSVDAPLAATWP